MTDDQLTPTSAETEAQQPVTAEEPTTVAPESGVVPSSQTATPEPSAPIDTPAEPAGETPVATATTDTVTSAESDAGEKTEEEQRAEDDLLFEAALASMEGGEESGREKGPRLSRGDRVEATVIQVEKDRVFVDLGTKAEGVVPLNELAEQALDTAIGHVAPGDKFEVVVIRPEGAEGNPIVSKRRADFDLAWNRIIESFEEGRVFQAQVVDRVKGGLVVDIGVRGFVPATHVGTGKLRNIEKYVGQTLPVKIIEIDRERRKVVLSNREAEEERRTEVRKNLFDKAQPGDILQGAVRRLTDYGAFVDLGGIDGLLHISEMSWVRIDHPREVLKEGQEINVMILRLDPGAGRISLGLRQVLPDPWNLVKDAYKVGQKIQVKVSRLVQGGAFVRLPEGAEAFLPLSEISNRRLKKPSEALEEGQEIEPTILDLRPDERRMVLTLRDIPVGEGGYTGSYGGYGDDRKGARGGRRGKRRREEPEPYETLAPTTRVATGGATIGERLGMLKGMKAMLKADEPEAEAQPQEHPQETPAEVPAEAPAEGEKE